MIFNNENIRKKIQECWLGQVLYYLWQKVRKKNLYKSPLTRRGLSCFYP